MEKKVREAFDPIVMPEETAQCIRREISHSSKPRRNLFRIAGTVAALLVAVVLAVNAEAVEQVLTSVWEGDLVWESGVWFFQQDDDRPRPTGTALPWVESVEGRVYFHAQGEGFDITDQISYDTAYIYTFTDGRGIIHYFCIGGTPDNLGWAEFTYNPKAELLGELGWEQGAGHNPWDLENDVRFPWMDDIKEKIGHPFPLPSK